MVGGLGVPELIIIFGIAVLVFGASRIPGIARALGKAIEEFRHAGKEITDGTERLMRGESESESEEKKTEDKQS